MNKPAVRQEKQAVAKAPPPRVLEEQTVAEERRRHRTTRRPRTMGVLFKRLPDGSLVRVDRAGNPLPKPTTESTSDNDEATTGKESGQSDESEVEDDDVDGSNSEPDTKPFVPAPIPKVSAWTQGTCVLILAILDTPGTNQLRTYTKAHQPVSQAC